jgi:hypothetical protein
VDFKSDPTWYETWPQDPRARWDNIYAFDRPGGGYYGCWAANPKGRPGFGFGESLDGVHWTALEPPVVENAGHGEVGAVEYINGQYYMLYGGGRISITADRPQGPWRPLLKNPNLLMGDAYFARFYPTPNELLINHHSYLHDYPNDSYNGTTCFAPLKRAAVDSEGILRLQYWEGNDHLKGKPLAIGNPKPAEANSGLVLLERSFDPCQGFMVEGTLRPGAALPKQLPYPPGPVQPFPGHLDLGGVYLEWESGRGVAAFVDRACAGEIGIMDAEGNFWRPGGTERRDYMLGDSARFRLLVKESMAEFYVDDIFLRAFSLPSRATGRVGFLGPDAQSAALSCRVWSFA